MLFSRGERTAGETVGPVPGRTAVPPPPPAGPVPREPPAELPRASPPPVAASGAAALSDHARFAGTGRIRGVVSVEAGTDFPAVWTLTVEPSRALVGGEHAESRALTFSAGEREFALSDLALGGYSLRAHAFGFDSGARHVLLAKPEADDMYLSFVLVPTGVLEGRVLFADGAGAEGLPLVLESRPQGARRATTAGLGGAFLFDDVRNGAHRLHVGAPHNPIVPALDLAFSGPAQRLDDIVVPPLGVISGRVVDELGNGQVRVLVRGYGDAGGTVETTTDSEGRYRAEFLPAGRYTLYARNELGTGRARGQLAAGATLELEIRIAR
jgi:hypothetical protein